MTVAKNVEVFGELMITDAVIREGSVAEDNSDDEVMFVSFIVDIASLKQTYNVTNNWSVGPDEIFDYMQVVACPKPEDLRFGPFENCLNSWDF